MDDSLSDFQDKKKCFAGSKVPKSKPKRTQKRSKGQKDIRTALKPKKNELESYTKDFDNVCKQAGIDVDSEQLQIAIALSKSLQEPSTEQENQPTTSQERVRKIRTTLLEYGFKIPEIKINKGKRAKKTRKSYKLLLTSPSEKETVIANKYSHIMFHNIDETEINTITDFTNIQLYYLATNAKYSLLKNNNNLYVEGLIEKSFNTGNLLRDWSEIPGRPVTPTIAEPIAMNFSEIDCSQDELDVVLSGTIKSCKSIVKSKVKNLSINTEVEIVINKEYIKADELSNKGEEAKNVYDAISGNTLTAGRSCSPDLFDDDVSIIDSTKSIIDKISQTHTEDNKIPIKNTTNRKSDDFMDITECVNLNHDNISLKSSQNATKRKSNDFMEMTKCVTVRVDDHIDLTQSPVENIAKVDEENATENQEYGNSNKERKVIENCYQNTEKPVELITNENLSMSLNEGQNVSVTNSPEVIIPEVEKQITLDLTQSSDTSEELPFVSLKSRLSEENDNLPKTKVSLNDTELLDITQNYTITEEIKEFNVKPPGASIFEEFIHNHSDFSEENGEVSNKISHNNDENNIDLTQNWDYEENRIINENNSVNIDQNHIDLTQNNDDREAFSNNIQSPHKNNFDVTQNEDILDNNDIDLTQSSSESLSDNSENLSQNSQKPEGDIPKISQRYSSLGKNDNISIDYDDIEPNTSKHDISMTKYKSFIQDNYEANYDDLAIINDLDNNLDFECSQNSEVFEISDKEFNYSINKSKADNFDIGGLSVIDNISKVVRNSDIGNRKSDLNVESDLDTVNRKSDYVVLESDSNAGNSKSDRDLTKNKNPDTYNNEIFVLENNTPLTPIKHKRISEISTPERGNDRMVIETPNKSKLIVKTNNITPMPRYDVMSTPEIHMELDRYGIKPFKRKRAIQLLTHIYNQMHPIIEYSDEDVTPSKRRKPNEDCFEIKRPSPRKILKSPEKIVISQEKNLISPEKIIKPPRKLANSGNLGRKTKENNAFLNGLQEIVYEVTNEPVIKDIPCDPSDWVFQKREKAKVHSCRVPLHIAFHNYVTSRRSLNEAILCYEPVHIDVIHKDLIGYGHRYDPKDLLKFLDKKCITVKTADNDARNQKR